MRWVCNSPEATFLGQITGKRMYSIGGLIEAKYW